jgi:formamidopyrimidine-DNA glycosylase
MPELPEVETTRRGILPHVLRRRVTAVHIRNPRLRWPVPRALARELPGRLVESIERRGKYLLLHAGDNHLLLHLGMSGSLEVVPADTPPLKHDHLDIVLDSGKALRLNDPRRFGAALWLGNEPMEHALLRHLGPEPLTDDFGADYFHRVSRKRTVAIKNFLMDHRVVVGVGNIYASEALFLAGIRPSRRAGSVTRAECTRLISAVRQVLEEAIEQGGTTLRDYSRADGTSGYFQLRLRVYDRSGDACPRCTAPVKRMVTGQRSTYYCPRCQR